MDLGSVFLVFFLVKILHLKKKSLHTYTECETIIYNTTYTKYKGEFRRLMFHYGKLPFIFKIIFE